MYGGCGSALTKKDEKLLYAMKADVRPAAMYESLVICLFGVLVFLVV